MKRCRRCQQLRPVGDFDAKRGACRECRREQYRTYYEANRSAVLDRQRARGPRPFDVSAWRRQRYGLDQDAFNALLVAQGGRCRCCGQPFDGTPVVDHDHRTGRVRGLLCGHCNCGIGLLKDDPMRCLAAARYLERRWRSPRRDT
jgi:hypothetical protein